MSGTYQLIQLSSLVRSNQLACDMCLHPAPDVWNVKEITLDREACETWNNNF